MWEDPRKKDKLIEMYIGKERYEILRKIANGIIDIKDTNFTEVK